jgi:hypothetical protein
MTTMNEWDRMVMIEQSRGVYDDLFRAIREHVRPKVQTVQAAGTFNLPDLRGRVVGVDLAKAESQSCATWLFSDVHLSVAADRIMALINSKPRSPTKAEILEAIHGAKA